MRQRGATMDRFRTFAKNALSSTVERAGYLIVPKWRTDARVEHAELLAKIFRNQDIDCVLDVGANRGQFKAFIRTQVHYQGLILSFEPLAELTTACKAAARADPNWHIFEMALGDRDCRAAINSMERDTFSSFLNPLNSDLVKRQFDKSMTVNARVDVEVRLLDTLLPGLMRRFKFSRPFLKLDTQGFDLAVINGATQSLKLIPALQTELSIIPIYQDMPVWIDVIRKLKEQGFALSGMFPISRDTDLRLVEFDGIFVKERCEG